ncbi:class I lanthipeptide [Pedobacter roseus]|uniref:Class I lanthipeptide n=1 Tax=Pedobacter roseus TaxID=336820 RepID=A0A7G9QDU8_9SPHI|nr:class I lanthipeptide [Pedobacter roseus]QNN41523.1 class I lanthipeptide [Pedobacter roseus]
MKKQPKIKLSLAKETIAKLNEEQMELIAGGYAASSESTTIIITEELSNSDGKKDSCNPTILKSKTCPATGSCACSCE